MSNHRTRIPNKRAKLIVRIANTMLLKNNYDFEQTSYSRWALKELYEQLNNNPDTPPLIVMENFRDLLDDFSTRNKYGSYSFSTAKDAVEWVIDLLLSK